MFIVSAYGQFPMMYVYQEYASAVHQGLKGYQRDLYCSFS